MKKLWRSALALLAAATALVVVPAPPAHASSTLLRYMSTSSGGHSIQTWMYEESGTGYLWMDAVITTGNLNGSTCAEFLHNLDLHDHRSGELLTSCLANTTKYVDPFYLFEQGGGIATESDIADEARKGITFCLTDQKKSSRSSTNCVKPTVSWWYGGAWQTAKSFDQPSWSQYDDLNYYEMLNTQGVQNLRWLGGASWNVDLEGGDLVVNAGSMWSSYYGTPTGNDRFLVVFQSDGNLVGYKVTSNTTWTAVWATGTYAPGAQLRIQADGNLVITKPGYCWNSQTWGYGIERWANAHNGAIYGYHPAGGAYSISGAFC